MWASKHRKRKKKKEQTGIWEEDEDDVVVDGVCLYIHVPVVHCTTTTTVYVCQYNSPSIHPSLLHPPTIAAGYILFAPAEKGGYYVACLLFNGTTQKPSGSGSFKSLLHTTAHRLCMYVCVCIYREKRRHAGNYGGNSIGLKKRERTREKNTRTFGGDDDDDNRERKRMEETIVLSVLEE